MACEDGWIIAEMATIQRLRIDPLVPIGQGDQRQGPRGAHEPNQIGRDNLDAEIGPPGNVQQMRTLVTHDTRAAHNITQATLVEYGNIQRAVRREETLFLSSFAP